jgi:hypothetical protein
MQAIVCYCDTSTFKTPRTILRVLLVVSSMLVFFSRQVNILETKILFGLPFLKAAATAMRVAIHSGSRRKLFPEKPAKNNWAAPDNYRQYCLGRF